MSEVTEAVERATAVGAGDGSRAALEGLLAEKPMTLAAAFAYAKRREKDPAMARAADALEIALALRETPALEGARWWQRAELIWGGTFVVHALNVFFNVVRSWGWPGLVVMVALFALTVLVLLWVRRRVDTGSRPPAPDPQVPPSMGRMPAMVRATLAAGREVLAAQGTAVDGAAAAMRAAAIDPDHPYGRLLGAAVLSATEQRIAMTFQPDRKALLQAAAAARRGLLAEVPELS